VQVLACPPGTAVVFEKDEIVAVLNEQNENLLQK
jgi:hypothetical protein